MDHHQPVTVDPRQLQSATAFWNNFTQGLKWSVIGIAIALAVLTALFIR